MERMEQVEGTPSIVTTPSRVTALSIVTWCEPRGEENDELRR